MHPYSSIDTTATWKKLRFILSVRSDFHMIESLSIAVHAFVSRVSMSFSVDESLLPKNGDFRLAKNYRGITLTFITAKIYNALLRNRIEPKIDNILQKNQNGFRRNRSTTSQILSIRTILEGVRAKNLQATLLFVDFTKAFDSIHRGKMEQILLAYGLPKETIACNNDSLQKHQSESTFTGWRHRIFWHCSRSTTRGHARPIPLYHLSRICA